MTPAMKQAKEALERIQERVCSGRARNLADLEDAGVPSAIAALESENADDGWMPIEGAPKDGTYILGYYKSPVVYGASHHFGIVHYECGRFVGTRKAQQPTHYRPLPAPPKEKA